jgi:hypothetical protein
LIKDIQPEGRRFFNSRHPNLFFIRLCLKVFGQPKGDSEKVYSSVVLCDISCQEKNPPLPLGLEAEALYELPRIPDPPSAPAKNPEGDSSTPGDLDAGRAELRAGMAQHSDSYREASPFFGGHAKGDTKQRSALLGGPQMPGSQAGPMSGMGIPIGTYLLVHQWNDVPGGGSGKLEQEDENLPELSGLFGKPEP